MAIHDVNKAEFAQELAGHINRRVVGTNQNNASALVVGLMQVLQSFHLVVGGQISFGVQPGQGHFDDPDARMAEVCPDEASLLLRVKRGKALGDIDLGNASSRACEVIAKQAKALS